LLGDANGDGLTNGTENTLFVSLAVAQQIIAASGSSADTRLIMAKQALPAQLNIDNAFQTGAQNKEPIDLVGEAGQVSARRRAAWYKRSDLTMENGHGGPEGHTALCQQLQSRETWI
jgi:hypothetical protein